MTDHLKNLDCPYCIEFIYRKPKPILHTIGYPYNSRIIFENDDAIVVPTIGAITPNYLLIIPKRHVISCKELTSKELNAIEECKELIERNIGHGTIFEHGSFSDEKTGGASIEHAHLHFIPVALDYKTILSEIKFVKIESILELSSLNSEYLLIWNNDGIFYTTSNSIPNQYFRRIIAEYFGVPDKWNWREYDSHVH